VDLGKKEIEDWRGHE
jgi:hypothetical protein